MLFIANIFQPLIDVFEAVLKFFHSVGVPWGWSIVLLTIAVRACLVPLTIKQMGSMARLQRLQPQLKEIQSKYKEDKQRQQQEMMKFYRENNANPLSSCLPLVAQLPVFISLYYMLRQSLRSDICPTVQRHFQEAFALKHHISVAAAHGQTVACGGHGANFLFIGDLTSQAAGITLIVLIVLYVGSQLASSLMMSAATMDPTQRKIMLFMPVVFVLFVIRFPAGVLVYWITTNLWTIAQQYVVKRRIGPVTPAAAAAGPSTSSNGSDSSPASARNAGRSRGSAGGLTAGARATGAAVAGGGASKESGNATSPSGGLSSLLRRVKAPAGEPVSTGARGGTAARGGTGGRGGTPPKSPRKKKKRSGRRR